jgi:hypothetical protein
MNRLLLSACLLLLPFAALHAQDATADPVIRAQLEKLDYKYKVDEDGDFKLTFDLPDDSDRSQVVWVRSPVETYGEYRMREIWSPAWRSDSDEFPADIANRLLEDSNLRKLGAWEKQGRTAMFVVKIPADANEQALDDAINLAIRTADEMERQLPGDEDKF